MQAIKFRISSKAIKPSDFVKAANAFYKLIEGIGPADEWVAYAEEGSTVFCAQPAENLSKEAFNKNYKVMSNAFYGFIVGDVQTIKSYSDLVPAFNDLSDVNYEYNKDDNNAGLIIDSNYENQLQKIELTQSKIYISLESFTGTIKQFSNLQDSNKHFKIKDEVTEQNIKFAYDSRLNTRLREDDRVTVVANVKRDSQGKINSAEALEIHQLPREYNGELTKAKGVLA